jgi:hypothetical protein
MPYTSMHYVCCANKSMLEETQRNNPFLWMNIVMFLFQTTVY